jgi:hypothetical protein
LPCDRERDLEMPGDVREWLPPEHLCWKVLDVVGLLDLSAFENSHRDDGRGGVAYPPASLIALLLYCYSKGVVPPVVPSRPAGTTWDAESSPRTGEWTTPPSRGSCDVTVPP